MSLARTLLYGRTSEESLPRLKRKGPHIGKDHMKEIEEVWVGEVILMPVAVDIAKKIKQMQEHEVFIALTDNVSMLTEIPQWCNQSGHRLLKVERREEEVRFFIEKVSPFLRAEKRAPQDVPPIIFSVDDDGISEWHSW